MRIAVLPADQAGCGFYRLIYPAKALLDQGADVVVDFDGPKMIWDRPWEGRKDPWPDSRIHGVMPYDADVVVMQRPGRRWWSDAIPHLQAQGIRVVVDVDDLFDQIPRGNAARGSLEKEHESHRWTDLACKLADAVTCTTPALLKRYGHGHGHVLPNLVPESFLSIYGLKRPHTIGWSGLVETHPGDLSATNGAVAQVLDGTDWSFHVIGTGTHVKRDLRLADEPTTSGIIPFAEYAEHVAELEVGIVPLGYTDFNRAKSALKASEMAAVGVPVVMSATPDNIRLHELGVGLLADSRSQWRRILTRLTSDDSWRYELAEQGREVMATQTYERHAERWLNAWTAPARVKA